MAPSLLQPGGGFDLRADQHLLIGGAEHLRHGNGAVAGRGCQGVDAARALGWIAAPAGQLLSLRRALDHGRKNTVRTGFERVLHRSAGELGDAGDGAEARPLAGHDQAGGGFRPHDSVFAVDDDAAKSGLGQHAGNGRVLQRGEGRGYRASGKGVLQGHQPGRRWFAQATRKSV